MCWEDSAANRMKSILYALLLAFLGTVLLTVPAEGQRVRRQLETSTTTASSTSSQTTTTSTTVTTTAPTTTTAPITTTTAPSSTTVTTAVTTTAPTTTIASSSESTTSTSTTTFAATSTTPASTTTPTTTKAATTVANGATQTTTTPTTRAASTTTARAVTATANGAVEPKVKCSSLSAKNLESCCQNPRFDFFTKKQKMVCNSQKFNPTLFAQTMEFSLHKLQNAKNNLIDFESDVTTKTLTPGSCLMECLFSNLKALSANGDVNETVLTNYLAKNLNEEWGIVIAEAVSDCVTDYDALDNNRAERAFIKKKTPKECSKVPNLIMQCVLKNIYESCPQSSQIETETCDKTRQKFSACHPFASTLTDNKRKKDKRRKFTFKVLREKTQVRYIKMPVG